MAHDHLKGWLKYQGACYIEYLASLNEQDNKQIAKEANRLRKKLLSGKQLTDEEKQRLNELKEAVGA